MAEEQINAKAYVVRDKQGLQDRLKKIEGQVRGLQRMIDEDRYCVDVLVQVAAVRAALNKVGMALFEGHARGCMQAAVKRGEGDQSVSELMEVLEKFVR